MSDTCQHCERPIVNVNGVWVDPEATGDDSVWRETCDQHDTFTAEHEPVVAPTVPFDPTLWETPIALTVFALQDAGRNVWITGFDPSRTRAFVIDGDNDFCTIASVDTCNGLGRWECRRAHYRDFPDLYHERFPLR